jgi:hypothetical protein
MEKESISETFHIVTKVIELITPTTFVSLQAAD